MPDRFCDDTQVRGPLTALRTLGSILAPRLQQAKGREVDRDVVKGMLTQVKLCQDQRSHTVVTVPRNNRGSF